MPKAVDEFLEYEGKRKEAFDPSVVTAGMTLGAGGGDWKRTLGQAALGTAMVYGLGTALGLGSKAFENKYNKIKSDMAQARGFRTMIKENPDLGEMDRKKTQAIYRSFHRLNPDMAADPFIAGSFVRRVGEVGMVTPDVAKSLVDTQRGILQNRDAASPSGKGLAFVQPGMQLAQQANMPYQQASADLMRDTVMAPRRLQQARPLALEQGRGQEQARVETRMRMTMSERPEEVLHNEAIEDQVGRRMGEEMALKAVSPNSLEYHKAKATARAQADVELATAREKAQLTQKGKYDVDVNTAEQRAVTERQALHSALKQVPPAKIERWVSNEQQTGKNLSDEWFNP